MSKEFLNDVEARCIVERTGIPILSTDTTRETKVATYYLNERAVLILGASL